MTDVLSPRATEELDRVIIRFAGDSGDGMQLTGERFTAASAIGGNDLATLPEFPAEIRAPAGTLAGVSAFQIHISDHEITTPGDAPNVLVAMNPAALRSQLHLLEPHGTVIINVDTFDERNLAKAGYRADPLTDDTLKGYRVYEIPMTTLTKEAVVPLGVKPRDADRSKNFFALGLVSWMYTRPVEDTLAWIERRFAKDPKVVAANLAAFNAGHSFGETAELFDHPYHVAPATLAPGVYTNITGNTALAWGIVAAGRQAELPTFLGSYPITPATDILHELSKLKHFGVTTFQAEDEIAGIGAAIGAAFGGALAWTTTSGPGMALKGEAMGLAVNLELPLVIVGIQRGGPSTGLPTKTEAADLLMAIHGRHGESPLPVIAAATASGCFDAAIEAARIALKYRTPVVLLSDGYLANGSEPWLLPDVDELPDIRVPFASGPNHTGPDGTDTFWPYLRDPETLARPWAVPGTPGLMHRIGGLEKEDGTGNVSYDPDNHQRMVRLRAAKIDGIANDIPPPLVDGDPADSEVTLVGWGSTWGAIDGAVGRLRGRGRRVAHIHLTHLHPLPPELGDLLRASTRVLVPELNLGQLVRILRAEYLVDAQPISQVRGLPFTSGALERSVLDALSGAATTGGAR